MTITDLQQLYAKLPQAGALVKSLEDETIRRLFLKGLVASSAPMLFSSVAGELRRTIVFILNDADEAGYFYNDLLTTVERPQQDAEQPVSHTREEGGYVPLFFPSSYRRAVKYGQKDAANEILRTEVLSRLAAEQGAGEGTVSGKMLLIVTYPQAVSELVVSQAHLDEHRITLRTSQQTDVASLVHRLRDLGFQEEDYVYEPGQF
ncbi:MAG: transcription-repair coupling factor, partial [Prevotella sp.]